MSIRYFYDDPLAAAWMAKHFDMKFIAYHTDEQMSEYDLAESQRNFDWFDSCIVDGWSHDVDTVSDAIKWIEEASGKIYLSEDSVKLLEPVPTEETEDSYIERDLCLTQRGKRKFYGTYHECLGFNFGESPIIIIQRNNKPFIWPKREVV